MIARERSPQAQFVGHLLAFVVAGVFIYAAFGKIREPRQFVFDIKNFQIVPVSLLHLMALILPWWEIGGAIALILPNTRRAGAIIISGLLVMFMVAVSYAAFYKGLNINCGCFGKDNPSQAGWKTIGLDSAMLAGVILALRFSATPQRTVAMGPTNASPAHA